MFENWSFLQLKIAIRKLNKGLNVSMMSQGRALYLEVINTHILKVIKVDTISKIHILEGLFGLPQLILTIRDRTLGSIYLFSMEFLMFLCCTKKISLELHKGLCY